MSQLSSDESTQFDHTQLTKRKRNENIENIDPKGFTISKKSKKNTEHKKILKDFSKRARGTYALEEICVQVDSALQHQVGGKQILDDLKLNFQNVSVEKLSIASSIEWRRRVPLAFAQLSQQSSQEYQEEILSQHDENDFEEQSLQYVLIRIPGDTIVELIQLNQLFPYARKVRSVVGEKIVVLLIEGLEKFLKSVENARYNNIVKQMSRKKKTVDKIVEIPSSEQIERSLLQVQIDCRFLIRSTNTAKQSSDFISGMTRHLAELPYKKQTNIFDFTKRNGNAAKTQSEAWKLQLMEIPSVSEKIATAIVKKYPTVRSLVSHYYNRKLDEDTKRNLLKDLKISSTKSSRKVGPVVSSKIFSFFVQDTVH